MAQSVVSVKNLEVSFRTEAGMVNAVRGLSFELGEQEVLGIVGESGSGKSVTSLALIGLLPKSAVVTGSVKIDGEEIVGRSEKEMYKLRGSKVSMIFQDPMTSLNPVYTIGWQIIEAVRAHGDLSKEEAKARAIELLKLSGIPRPEQAMESYPHEFSGGQRQRIGLARALALNPRLIVADEPVSALDVSIQAQILNLMKELQAEHGLTYVMISHDLAVVYYMADTIAVMYLGKIVEIGDAESVFRSPAHPYTQGLLNAVPVPDPAKARAQNAIKVSGELPSVVNPPSGCRFRTRCSFAQDVCAQEEPPMRAFGESQQAACHFPLRTPVTVTASHSA